MWQKPEASRGRGCRFLKAAHDGTEKRGGSYAGVERDNVAIHLQAASETKRLPGHGAINVFVTGVNALYQELKSKGVRTMEEPADRPYGMRDFDINDLDGNQLSFGEPTSD